MGTTESQRATLERQYKLIRRFASELYEGSEVTVIQHKQTKQHFVLKEFVEQFRPQKLVNHLQAHSSLPHPNLIPLRRFWIENDVSICSNLSKVYTVFEYQEMTMEEWLLQNKGSHLTDTETADFVEQITTVLDFLKGKGVFHLLAGPKSISVSHSHSHPHNHHRTTSKSSEAVTVAARTSFTTEAYGKEYEVDSELRLGSQRRVYKIFQPLEQVSLSQSFHSLDYYLQVPVHTSISSFNESGTLPDVLVNQQNSLTIGLMTLMMCEGCNISELDIFTHGRLELTKYQLKIRELKKEFPITTKLLQRLQAGVVSAKTAPMLKIKDVALVRKKKQSRKLSTLLGQHTGGQQLDRSGHFRNNSQNIILNLQGKASYKRISFCQM